MTHRTKAVAVNVNWNADNDEWNVNANRFDDNQWNEGNVFLSPETARRFKILPMRDFVFLKFSFRHCLSIRLTFFQPHLIFLKVRYMACLVLIYFPMRFGVG